MSNRLADQPAVLDWVSTEMRAAGHHQPLLPTRGRMSFETVTAAVDLALRHLAGQPMTREEALAMGGAHAIVELPADVPPLAAA